MENISQFAMDLETFFRSEEERVTICFHTLINDDENCKTSNKDVSTKSSAELFISKRYYEDDLASLSPSSTSTHSCLETHDWSSEVDSQGTNRRREYSRESEEESSASASVSACSSLLISSSATPDNSVGSDTDVW